MKYRPANPKMCRGCPRIMTPAEFKFCAEEQAPPGARSAEYYLCPEHSDIGGWLMVTAR